MTKARELAELARTISDTSDATAITINSSEEVTLADDLFLADGKKVVFGAGSDLEIYHSGIASHVKETGTGNLKIEGTNIELNNGAGNKTYLLAVDGGAVQLRYDDGTRLTTTSSGVDISGTLSATGVLTVIDGSTSAPSISNAGDSNTGIYFPADDELGLLVGGSRKLHVTSSGVDIENGSLTGGAATFSGSVTAGDEISITKSGQNLSLNTPSGSQNAWIQWKDNGTAKWELGKNTANNFFLYSYGASGTVLTVDNSGNTTFSGSVTADGLTVGDTSVSQSIIQMLANSTNGANTIHFGDGTSADAYRGYINYAHDSDSLQFAVGGAERMRISGGRLGIGDTNPAAPLSVSYTSNFANPLVETNAGVNIEGSSSVRILMGTNPNSPYEAYIQASNNGSGFPLLLNPSGGNVGIMTSNPQAAKFSTTASGILEVAGTKPVLNIHETDVTDAELFLGMSGGTALLGTTGDGILRFLTGTSSASEAMRIDSSGKVLIGKNTIAFGTAGVRIDPTNIQVTASGATAAYFNRLSSDGRVAEYYKDSTLYGAISVKSGDLVIHSTTTDHVGLSFGNTRIEPTNNYGTTSDNTVDLGNTDRRFKNLFLSGGVYVGGTGSANHLDDYESASWSPAIRGDGTWSAGTQTYLIRYGTYVKIGDFVWAGFDVQVNNLGTVAGSYLQIGNLPFHVSQSHLGGGLIGYYSNLANTTAPLNVYMVGNQGYLMEGHAIYVALSDATNYTRLMGVLVYRTSA